MDPIAPDAVPGAPQPEEPAADPPEAPRSREPRVPAPARSAEAGLAWLHHARDFPALERMLLAWSVHPLGAGFDRARWLVWSPARDLLAGRLWWQARTDSGTARAALIEARRATPLASPSFTLSQFSSATVNPAIAATPSRPAAARRLTD